MKTCKTCAAWRPFQVTPKEGTCHRNAPQLYQWTDSKGQERLEGRWPPTFDYEGCFDHAPITDDHVKTHSTLVSSIESMRPPVEGTFNAGVWAGMTCAIALIEQHQATDEQSVLDREKLLVVLDRLIQSMEHSSHKAGEFSESIRVVSMSTVRRYIEEERNRGN